MAAWKVGDRVRVTSTKEFGIVAWEKNEVSVELLVLQNDLRITKVPYRNDEIQADYPLDTDAIYVNRKQTAASLEQGGAKVAYAKVVQRQNALTQNLWATAKPPKHLELLQDKFLSTWEYRFEGKSEFINGCYVSKNPPRDITASSGANDFFSMIERKVPLINIPEDMRIKGYCIAYRGDTREPERVFKEGFNVWEDHATPVFRSASDDKPHYDILSPSGVCASGIPEGGCIFPLIEEGSTKLNDAIYLYGFIAHHPFATIQIQKDLKKKLEEKPDGPDTRSQIDFINNLLKAKEIVVGKEGVAGSDVFAACRIQRQWRSDQWVKGADLAPKEFYFNPNADLKVKRDLAEVRDLFNSKVINSCKETPTFA